MNKKKLQLEETSFRQGSQLWKWIGRNFWEIYNIESRSTLDWNISLESLIPISEIRSRRNETSFNNEEIDCL